MGGMSGCRCHIRQRADDGRTAAKHAFTPWAAADASRGIFLRLTACTVDGTWTRALLRGETSSDPKASKLRLKSTLLESMHLDDCLAVMLAAHADGRVYMPEAHGCVHSSFRVLSNTRMPGPAVILGESIEVIDEGRAWHPNVICRSPSQRTPSRSMAAAST
ncbi:hypothetical protein GGP41_005131 [Bipolaris sorokiniana]|uniref:Uncharacterized protein n=1 Tax=Cochliobolus sativus TaxID=45130 RepID=A0A8H6DVQ5_COCSA|nr:hypothetical protein GGP41_005131 [Bipolaris sorokiniana]